MACGSLGASGRHSWAPPRPESTRTGRGVVSRRYPLNYEMGLGHERFNEDLMAWASDWRMSESNHRHFYRRWVQLMATHSWAEV